MVVLAQQTYALDNNRVALFEACLNDILAAVADVEHADNLRVCLALFDRIDIDLILNLVGCRLRNHDATFGLVRKNHATRTTRQEQTTRVRELGANGNRTGRRVDNTADCLDAALLFVDCTVAELQLDGWQRPCTRLYSAGSAVAASQNNPVTRAGVCRPVAVESVGNDGARVALLYPSQGDAPRFRHFVYEAEFNADEGLDGCSNQLADAVAYNCAALLYSVFERPDAANMFLSLAMALCNGNNIERR